MQKHFGGIVRTVKDLKCSVDALEKKVEGSQHTEINDIINTQKVIDEVISANADAIKRIDEEFVRITKVNAVSDVQNDTHEVMDDDDKVVIKKTKSADTFTPVTVGIK